MKKVFVLIILFCLNAGVFAQTKKFTELKDFLQEFQTCAVGGYINRMSQISKGVSVATLQKYMQQWKGNYVMLRGIQVSEAADVIQSPLGSALIIRNPLTDATLSLSFDIVNNYWVFTGQEVSGDFSRINQSPLINGNSIYKEGDFTGNWEFEELYFLGGGVDNEDFNIEERKKLINPAIRNIIKLKFWSDGNLDITESVNGIIKMRKAKWKIQYNQLLWDGSPMSFRITPEGKLAFSDTNETEGDFEMHFGTK